MHTAPLTVDILDPMWIEPTHCTYPDDDKFSQKTAGAGCLKPNLRLENTDSVNVTTILPKTLINSIV
jgi:hypothetical protein